jgi:hypothetical protein
MRTVVPSDDEERLHRRKESRMKWTDTAAAHGWLVAAMAADWKTLKAQVRRWQSVSSLGWNEEDIDYVTRYLNTRYYDFVPQGTAPGAARAVLPVEVAPGRATVRAH